MTDTEAEEQHTRVFGYDIPRWVSADTGISLAVKGVLAVSALLAVLVSSIVLYSIFYRLYVPQLLHESAVHMQYHKHNTSAVVDLVPAANYKLLSTSQAYSVALHLDVPTSEANEQLGNFMVTVELCDRSGTPVHTASRPAILPYRSSLVKVMQTAVRAVPLALGWMHEKTVLDVRLMEGMYDRRFAPITVARVALSRPVQVYKARIVIMAEFSGLRYWMFYWRTPTAVLFVALAVVWQLAFTAVAWSVLEAYTRSRQGQREEVGGMRSLTPSPAAQRIAETKAEASRKGEGVEIPELNVELVQDDGPSSAVVEEQMVPEADAGAGTSKSGSLRRRQAVPS
ncbi:DUF1226-domain-containing protein [Linderina pennispora]|uniref:DUF1226-domain-containing protein n=1 Tax=Linderina pennispora TaxID=61395 RepID=A0A1Y1WA78_9FUNG|nr:DUF1226-domain-containing protein [Linderina pennispora]ORX70136.1 DUF1226-domain-containing protein [Linderina pennispora]